ncbi:uncharacterized protein ACHE_20664S [Aspergillus chevalieri]|uniref:Uncharacterized protein n=1 Tax=Aspergillus chevalieri TaxID=182096 RepID=A0A7R7ZLA9_ASPCH|nr:uncharacterized protein ACHE_20664S [Aspergillus chevalieri]BCR85206.1 hypothetical protein ACHE_20664S [Aspergillus chevalieri]
MQHRLVNGSGEQQKEPVMDDVRSQGELDTQDAANGQPKETRPTPPSSTPEVDGRENREKLSPQSTSEVDTAGGEADTMWKEKREVG